MRAHICRGERERDDASIIVFCTRARVGEQRFDDTKVLSGVFGGLSLCVWRYICGSARRSNRVRVCECDVAREIWGYICRVNLWELTCPIWE